MGTVEIGIEAQIHDWAAGELVLLDEPGEDFDVDTATLTIGPPDGSWHFTGGKYAVPFGAFETSLISDPLTLELGETAETALGFGFSAGGFEGSVFVFNGDSNVKGRDRIDAFGAALGWAMESEEAGVGVNVSYISDIGDADSLQDAIADALGSNDVADRVPGVAASAMVSLGGFTLIGEYLAATDEFQAAEVAFLDKGAKPQSWMVEAAYGFKIGEKDATIAASYQGTDEALALELPKKRFLVGLSVEMFEGVSLALEWARDGDYGEEDGGTGKNASAITAKLAAEFQPPHGSEANSDTRRTTQKMILAAAGLLFLSPAVAAPEESGALRHYAAIAHAKYEDSLRTARNLRQAVGRLIARPTEKNLEAARRAWRAARFPCQQSEVYRFGNAIVDDWEGKVNAWPLDEGLIDYGADSEENAAYRANIIANASFALAGKTIDARRITKKLFSDTLRELGGVEANMATGYHAIEFLLWGQDLNGTGPGAGRRPASDFDPANCSGGSSGRRAAYLKAAADLLVDDLA